MSDKLKRVDALLDALDAKIVEAVESGTPAEDIINALLPWALNTWVDSKMPRETALQVANRVYDVRRTTDGRRS